MESNNGIVSTSEIKNTTTFNLYGHMWDKAGHQAQQNVEKIMEMARQRGEQEIVHKKADEIVHISQTLKN